MSILCKSCSHHDLIDTTFRDNFNMKIPSISSKARNKNINFNKKDNNLHLRLFPIERKKYTNNTIFSKREFYFNKSLEKNKTTFKYNKYSSFDELIKPKQNKNIRNKINKLEKNNKSNLSLYLTEYVYKNKNNFKINKSHFFENGRDNNNINKTNYFNNLSNNSNNNITKSNNNSLLSNYLGFCRGNILNVKSMLVNQNNATNANNVKINLKLYNPKYLLKAFEIDIKKEKLNKQKIELEYKQLYKKNRYLNSYQKKENEKIKYIDSLNDYLKEKINLTTLKEKKNYLKEEIKNELNLLKFKEKEVKKNYEDFNQIFFVKFYDYIKKISKEIQKQKLKDDKYIDDILLLKKDIYLLKNEIDKAKINFEFLNKFALLNASIKLRKLSLPNYYKYVLENKLDELKKLNLNKEEINNIKKYRININYEEMLSLLDEYENKDLDLLSELNYLRNDIVILNKQKQNLSNDLKNKNNSIKELINEKEKILEKEKAKNHELINNRNIMNLYVKKNINDIIEMDSSKRVRRSVVSINYSKLYDKITNIFNNLNDYLNHSLDNIKIPKEKNGIQSLILFYLKKIEDLTIILLNKINIFKKNNKKEFKKMLGESIKIRKVSELRKERELSMKMMKKRVEEKNKKVITKKRINIYNYNVLNKHKKKRNIEKIIKIDTIYDYLNPGN